MTEGTAVALAEPESREVATAAPAEPGTLLAAIVGMARDPAVNIPALQALMAMQERLEERQAEREFNEAFIAMKPELPVIERDAKITYEAKGSKAGAAIAYATIENIDEQITPILQRFGFAPSYSTRMEGERLITTCILRHRGGHKTATDGPPLPCDSSGGKNSIQGWGSAMTYGRRYSLIDALNIRIKGKDDDGKLGGTKFVTTEQAAEIDTLLRETASNIPKFLEHYQVADVRNLTADDYVAAKNALLSKKAKRGEQ